MKLKITGLIITVLLLAGCNAMENDSTSGTMLQIVSLTDKDAKLPVFSDVSTAINDICMAEINALPLDPGTDPARPVIITPYMDVLIDQIDVEFRRTDGRNVEGVDVPYRFTQPLSFLITINGSAKIPLMLIRHVAKLEPPLFELSLPQNQEKILELVAVVTIHGKDLGGHRVAPVTGYVSVWCGYIAVPTTPGAIR